MHLDRIRRQLLEDIHSGTYGNHTTPRSLVGNAFRQGFYGLLRYRTNTRWREHAKDANTKRQTHLPAQALQTIPITWTFAV
jgi:hypothetical protein